MGDTFGGPPAGTEINMLDDKAVNYDPADYLAVVFDRAGEVVEFERVNVNFDDDRWSNPVYEFRIKDEANGVKIRVTAVYEDEGEETY